MFLFNMLIKLGSFGLVLSISSQFGSVRLGSIRLGLVSLGYVKFASVRFVSVRLD